MENSDVSEMSDSDLIALLQGSIFSAASIPTGGEPPRFGPDEIDAAERQKQDTREELARRGYEPAEVEQLEEGSWEPYYERT